MRVSGLVLAVALGACAAPPPQIVGRYASLLSDSDIEQIRVVAAAHLTRLNEHPTGPPRRLEVIRPDFVRVAVPIQDRYADTIWFEEVKRRGRWIIRWNPGENVIVY